MKYGEINNTEQIKSVFGDFVEALENNDMVRFESLFTEDAVFDTTHLGQFNGIEEAKERFQWRADTNYARYRVFNFAAFTQKDTAVQSAYVSALVGSLDAKYFHPFQFSGHYLNTWVKTKCGWKISNLKYNLDMESGNTLFVKDAWNLIDYTKFNGCFPFPILSEAEAPWRSFENPDNKMSDKDLIKDAFYRYCWGIDEADFVIFRSRIKENVTCEMGNASIDNLDDLTKLMKYKRFKEPAMSHYGKIQSIEIGNNEATLTAYRHEPHRLGTKILNKTNMNEMFYSLKWTFYFVKENNIWFVSKIVYNVGVFVDEEDSGERFL